MGVIVTLPKSEEFSKEEFLNRRESFLGISGVYVLRNSEGLCLYVGKSSSLGRRLLEHLSGKKDSIRFYKDIASISLYCSGNMFYVDVYETYLINELRPKFNRDKMYFEEHTSAVSDTLDKLEEAAHQLEEERRWLILEIEDFERFKEDEYDEQVVMLEWLELTRRLRELDRNLQRVEGRRALYRRRLSVSGGAS
jgi:hypothetical protein